MMRSFWARTESRSACRPRSASNSSTSRYDKEKRRYQPTARRMTSGSNCLHLNRPETDDARSNQHIRPLLQSCNTASSGAVLRARQSSIARVLDVARVLEGTVRRDGNRVRITTELIDAETDRTLWSDSFDRDLTDIFAIQSEIAQTVVAKLSARLSPEEKSDIQEKPTANLEAYDLYLQAK